MEKYINELLFLLKNVRDVKTQHESLIQRCNSLENGIFALLLACGIPYQHQDDNYELKINEKTTFFLNDTYLEAYLGSDTVTRIRQQSFQDCNFSYEETSTSTMSVADAETILATAEKKLSSIYKVVVLNYADDDISLQSLSNENQILKKRISELSIENQALKDKLSTILGKTIGLSNHSTEPMQKEKGNVAQKSWVETTEQEINDDVEEIVSDGLKEIEMELMEDDESDADVNASIVSNNDINDDDSNAEYGIFPYQDDIYEMAKHAFCFIYSRVYLKDKNDQILDTAEVFVIPLSTKTKYPDLLVWIAHNQHTETNIYLSAAKHQINFGNYGVLLSGVMKGKEFKSYITAQKSNDENTKIVVESTTNGQLGHLYLKDNDDPMLKVHICPVTFSNGEDGFANIVYCIERNGEYLAFGDNSEGAVTFLDSLGNKKVIMAKWSDNSLFGMISIDA